MDELQLDLAMEYHRTGRWQEAEEIYRRALISQPDIPEILYNLGTALKSQRKLPQAIAAFQRALQLRPQFPECLNNLANALRESYQPAAAIDFYHQAISQRPDFAQAWNNLGLAFKDTAQLDDALAAFRQAIQFDPNHPAAFSNILCTLHFHPVYDAAYILDAARQWAGKFSSAPLDPPNIDDHPHRLRIGYTSPYFRPHCQSLFTTPLLSHHNHDAVEIFCYSDAAVPDAVTDRLQKHADHWRNTAGFTDDQWISQIRADKIDILIDLTMHMAGHRLLAFARKPAPIQLTYLAYPGTTGLSTIDYRLTDPYLDPSSDDDTNYSETSLRLPDTFWCYDPHGSDLLPDANSPSPNPLPALSSQHFTFGCLNNFCKVTDATLALWSKVLKSILHSRLILLAPPGPHRDRVIHLLDVAPDRIQFVEFQPRRDYLQQFNAIDISLDTIPYNGHTTSLDSLWMGVPVLTRIGHTVVGRAGQSQLHNLNLPQFIAHTDDQFIQTAISLASDLNPLAELRSTLRHRMENSPLMNVSRFTGGVEALYRQIAASS